MKIHELVLVFFIIVLPSCALAGWQVVKQTTPPVTTTTTVPKDADPFIQASQASQEKPAAPIKETTEVKEVKETQINSSTPVYYNNNASRYRYNQIPPSRQANTYINNGQMNNNSIKTNNVNSNNGTYHSYYRSTPYSYAASSAKTYSPSRYRSRYTYINVQAPVYAVSVSGSVKENVERIMRRYHWKVIWKAPYDYNFDGRITGSSLPNVIEKLFQPFPLQAVMYMSNRTLAVVPRNKT